MRKLRERLSTALTPPAVTGMISPFSLAIVSDSNPDADYTFIVVEINTA